jgi:uncharacterized protein (DUF2147 family)
MMIAAMALAFPAVPCVARAATDIVGVWNTDDGLGAIEIAPCGAKRCGHIVWIKTPLDENGQPLRDANNPNPALKGRHLCGAKIVSGLTRQSDNSWDRGTIYDPEEGKNYSVAMKVLPGGNLEVTGYLGHKGLSETMVWTRRSTRSHKCSR